MTDAPPASPDEPASRDRRVLSRALLPLRAVDPQLHVRAVDHVLTGEDPEVVERIDACEETDRLFGCLEENRYGYIGDENAQLLSGVGVRWPERMAVPPRDRGDVIRELRDPLYRDGALSAPQWVRLGGMLRAIRSTDYSRKHPPAGRSYVPDWLRVLIVDVLKTCATADDAPRIARDRPGWTPGRLARLLRVEGVDEARIPEIMLRVWILAAYIDRGVRSWGDDLPGLPEYLEENGRRIPATILRRLDKYDRVRLVRLVSARPVSPAPLARLLVPQALHEFEDVRREAIGLLGRIPADERRERLREVLAGRAARSRAGLKRAAALIDHVAAAPEDCGVLDEAARDNPALAAPVEQTRARLAFTRWAMREADREPPTLPGIGALDDRSAEEVKGELWRILNRVVDDRWDPHGPIPREEVARREGATEADVEHFIAVADGRATGLPRIVRRHRIVWIESWLTGLSMTHLVRLESQYSSPDLDSAVFCRYDPDTDPRAVEELLARMGASVSARMTEFFWDLTDPRVLWPWASQHPDLVAGKLAKTTTAPRALNVLAYFPRLPVELMPAVAALAVGSSVRARSRAQALLADSDGALLLAEPLLRDPDEGIRRSAASWLGSLDPERSLPVLRRALETEESPLVRAALLEAVGACGGDTSALLAPGVLLEEARAGLAQNASAGPQWLEWRDVPPVRWADGEPVPEQIIRWWVVLADRLRNPDGRGLIGLYTSLLDAGDARALGAFLVRAWIARDTRHPDPEESRRLAEAVGKQRYDENQQWLVRCQTDERQARYLEIAQKEAAVTLKARIAAAYAKFQGEYLGSAMADKGLVAFAVCMDDGELAELVRAYMRDNPLRRAQLEALLRALRANGRDRALQVLLGVARRHKMAGIQATAAALVREIASERGWSDEELADRTVPTAGFDDDGLLRLSYGEREFTGRLTPDLKIRVTGPDCRSRAGLPAPRAGEDAEVVKAAKKRLSAARKEAKTVLTAQTERLREAMCLQRSRRAGQWREHLLAHPLMSVLAQRLIWTAIPPAVEAASPAGGTLTFRPTEDGALIGTDDAVVELDDEARVTIAHGTLLGPGAVAAWRQHLADYGVEPLFDQLDAALPSLEPGCRRLDDFEGHVTDVFAFRAAVIGRGYRRGPMRDENWFTEYVRPFPGTDLTAVLTFSGSFMPEQRVPCATGVLELRHDGGRRAVPLAEVPPVLLAECYADYRAVAALGSYDPDWRERIRLW